MEESTNLTEEEQAYIDKLQAEMKFYDKYKQFMGEVKSIFLHDGPEAAKKYICDSDDHLLSIACDELFWSLFTNL